MALVTCNLCRKIFTAVGGRTCPACKKRLDDLYMEVRDFLRDNPKVGLNVDSLANALDADIRDVQALVDLGYIDRDMQDSVASVETDRQKLAQAFEKSLNDMKAASAAAQDKQRSQSRSVSYASQVYTDKGRKR